MKWCTEIALKPSPFSLAPDDKITFLGSCFAENIGRRYPNLGAQVLVNPLGIAFNPFSIAQQIEQAPLHDALFVQQEQHVYHHAHHSRIFAPSQEAYRENVRGLHARLSNHIKQSRMLCITFGTAWVYVHNMANTVVANNHKVDVKHFTKKLLGVAEIKALCQQMVACVKALSPTTRVLFSVSPVKHLRDGLVENSAAKARLLAALSEFCENESADYFPAFELLNDQLRDYRFYAEDMAHPNQQAQNVVYDAFKQVYFSEALMQKSRDYEAVLRLKNHRPIDATKVQAHQAITQAAEADFLAKWETKNV